MAFFLFKKKAHFPKKTPTPMVILFHFISFFLTFSLPLRCILSVTSGRLVIMAVVNSPYVGIARGRLGEGVYSRVKGQTTVRGYNPSPMNPRSSGQQSQRAQFSSAVKFFSRGVQNFFKFAFENKAEKESDYNAFMRLNANAGMYFGPAQNANPAYPAVGKFQMTKGSLPSVDYGKGLIDPLFVARFTVDSAPVTVSTFGELSRLLVDYGYQQGDIVTFCFIQTDWVAGSRSNPLIAGSEPARWSIRQFTIDVTSTVIPSELGIAYSSLNSSQFEIDMAQDVDNDYCCAGCVCVSRPSASGLKVSSSVLWLNGNSQVALLYGQSPEWKALVLEAWRTSGNTILQGSRSVNSTQQTTVEVATDPALPAEMDTEAVLYIYFSDIVEIDDLVAHLVVESSVYGVLATSKSGNTLKFTAEGEQTAFFDGVLETDNSLAFTQNSGTAGQITSVRWV